jgi:hypothetical protein
MKPSEITLDWLYARVVERDGCLIWIKHIGDGGPQANIDYKCRSVRREIWSLVHDRKIPSNQRIGVSCGNPACVHPDHLIARKPAATLAGRPISVTHRRHIAEARRAESKFSDDVIHEIRMSDMPAPQAAEHYGMDQSYVHYIRKNENRIDYRSPFAGLGA